MQQTEVKRVKAIKLNETVCKKYDLAQPTIPNLNLLFYQQLRKRIGAILEKSQKQNKNWALK